MLTDFETKILSHMAFEKTCGEIYRELENEYWLNNPNSSLFRFHRNGPGRANLYSTLVNMEQKGYIMCVGRRRYSNARVFRRTGKRDSSSQKNSSPTSAKLA